MPPLFQVVLSPILLLLLLTSCPAYSQPAALIFAPSQSHCTGGSAQSQLVFHPHRPIHCTRPAPPDTRLYCHVPSIPFYTFFFRISNTNVICPTVSSVSEAEGSVRHDKCVLEYQLDFTIPAVFVLGLVATALCAVMLAAAMYMAVGRVTHAYYESLRRMERERQKEEQEAKTLDGLIPPLPRGYGSFGRRLDVIGGWNGSFSSLVEMEEGQSDGDRDDEVKGKGAVVGGKGDRRAGAGWDGWQDDLYFG